MKVIHTSDWHIGRTLRSYSRDDDFSHFVAQLSDIMAREQPDALLVSGDIYDNPTPSVVAQHLLVKSLLSLHEASPRSAIVITGGNHDSGIRLDVYRPVWEAHNVTVVGSDVSPDEGNDYDLSQFVVSLPDKGYVLAVPYYHKYNYPIVDDKCRRENRQADFFKALLEYAASINTGRLPVFLMAHIAISGSDTAGHDPVTIGGEDCVPAASLGAGADYVALGHIHKPQWITADNAHIRYSGSPFPMTFAEDYEHSVTIVEIDKHGGAITTQTVPLHALHRLITIPAEPGSIDDALEALCRLDAEENSFVRLQVLMSSKLPADADMRAYKAAENKKYRFCNFLIVDDTPESQTKASSVISLEQIGTTSPVEIAKKFYQSTISSDMPDELFDMLAQVISEVDSQMKNTTTET